MDVAVVDRFFALATLLGGLVGIALVVWAVIDRRSLTAAVGPLLHPVAVLVAVGATVGSLAYSEVFGRAPCSLCWYQRIFMYSAAVIGVVSLVRRDRAVLPYVGTLAIFGGIVSIAHVLEQNTSWFSAPVCVADVPCSIKYVNEFGFVSIPVMALGCFILIAAASLVAARTTGDEA